MLPPVTRTDRVWCRMDGVSHRSVAYLTWSSGNGLVVQRTRRIGEAQRHSLLHNTIGEHGSAATDDERPSVSAVVAVH
ncbi:hypothetical protein MTO96_011247 [Rhipicephalus appendiculatus]